MTRSTPRWGLFFAFDVLLDIGLALALLGIAVARWQARDAVGFGYSLAGVAFVLGTSLLVRAAIVPLVRGEREIKRMTQAPRHRRSWR